jgi:hypothetical protein
MDKAGELAKYNPADPNEPTILKKPVHEVVGQATFESATLTRNVDLIEGDSSQQVTIGAGLAPA